MRNLIILLPILFQHVVSKPFVKKWATYPILDDQSIIIPSCDSKIYCQGKLLDTVQLSKLYNDSKSFVDLSQKYSAEETLKKFEDLMEKSNNTPSEKQLKKFLDENFEDENKLTLWTPSDYTENPAFINKIKEEDVKTFAQELVKIWPTLGRKIVDDVGEHPDRHSIVKVPNGFIIPGERFKELYYWDSYWIMEGLLLSEMYDTVKGMLGNMVYLIKTFGFIPNGARVYYVNRSQPPLFSSMVAQYISASKDTKWLAANIKYLETELNFWLKHKTTVVKKNGNKYELAHYDVKSNTPRPESYAEDVATCAYFKEEKEQRKCYSSLKSGAESGLDFSTRWFFLPPDGVASNLTFIDTARVIPVDLNAILCKAFRDLSEFYGILGDKENQDAWLEKANTYEKAIEEVLYDNKTGIWFDYDNKEQKPRKTFCPSNFAPLWAKAYDKSKKNEFGQKAAKYFTDQGLNDFQGGIPSSLVNSGEQWDFPNAWPPHQDFVITGLQNTGNKDAKKIAKDFAQKWISSNLKAFDANGVMFEKYDAVNAGQYGGGGEYTVQSGFGWSNGIALKFINLFYSSD